MGKARMANCWYISRGYQRLPFSRHEPSECIYYWQSENEKLWRQLACATCVSKLPSISSTYLLKLTEPFDTKTVKSISGNHFDKISLILDLCFGERHHLEHTNDEHNFLQLESLRKAVPSGGGRHPTRSISHNTKLSVWFGAKGLYHYNVQKNSLDLLERKNFQSEVESCISASNVQQMDKPDAYIFLALFARGLCGDIAIRDLGELS